LVEQARQVGGQLRNGAGRWELDLSPDLQACVGGPAPFVELIRQQLLAIRHELFGPELVA
jgi:hypothetical protein